LVAMPLPRPVPPPVMNTTLSLKVSGGSMVERLAGKNLDCGRACLALLESEGELLHEVVAICRQAYQSGSTGSKVRLQKRGRR
jgi:hypothetical protein